MLFSTSLARTNLCRGLLFALFCGLFVSVAPAQDRIEPLHDGELFTGQRMRYVFHDVVKPVAVSTVSFLSDGNRIALGTIVGADGWIVSKASQISRANRVELHDGRQFAILSRHLDRKLDLALVKIDAQDLTQVNWLKEEPPLGSWFVTVGVSPDDVIAVGVLSVPRHQIPRSDTHGFLGVELEQEQIDSACIKHVRPNGAAAAAGLRKGDVVVSLDEQTIGTAQQLTRLLKSYRPGDTLTLRVRRMEEELNCPVTLMPPYDDFLSRMAFQNQMGGDLSYRRDDFEAVYQHDSVIDPKDCGGPVVNLDGHVVGINIARAGRTESYALPADLVEAVVEQLKSASLHDVERISVETVPALPAP